MSAKKEFRNDLSRRVTIVRNGSSRYDETLNSTSINDVTTDFDCIKISILNKAKRVSGEFDRVTLGPRANNETINSCDSSNEVDNSKENKSKLNGSTSSRSNLSFSIKKILLENEVQRREKVKKVVEKKKKEMEESQRNMQDELSQLLSQMTIRKEKETAEKLARLEAEEEQLAQQLEIDRRNELERLKQKESEEIFKEIIPYRDNFYSKWKDIKNISKACRDQNSASRLLSSYADRLKALSVQWEPINEKAKAGDLTLADLRMTEMIVRSNSQIFQSFKADAEQIEAAYDEEIARRELEVKRAELQVAQEEALRLKQEQDAENAAKEQQRANEQQAQNQQAYNLQNQQVSEVDYSASQPPQYPNTGQEVASIGTAAAKVSTDNQVEESCEYPDSESFRMYTESKEFLESYKSTYKDFVQSDAMKKFKFECQKTLNITINSVSHVSREQLVDKYDKLRLFLSGKGSPNILLNPQAEAYSKSLLAQKILDQGDTTISSKPELAFPFAAIVVALWNDWPDFGKILLARFRSVSPFFAPVFFVPRNDQTEEEYYKSLGCKYNEDGTPEKPDKFWKRLGGYMYLYASILVTKQRQGINKPHPHGLSNAWRWLAAMLNIEPRSDTADVCATLLVIMLQIAGNDLWKTYPNQFPKLLFIVNIYYEKLKSYDQILSAPVSRLGDFIATAWKQGFISPPKGQLPPNFW